MTFGNRTKGDILKHALAYALIKVRVARHRLGLSEAMRAEVAEDTVRRLRETGQWKELDDEAGRLSPLTSSMFARPQDKAEG